MHPEIAHRIAAELQIEARGEDVEVRYEFRTDQSMVEAFRGGYWLWDSTKNQHVKISLADLHRQLREAFGGNTSTIAQYKELIRLVHVLL